MATVTITLRDSSHGTIEISGDGNPIPTVGEERTPAQELGFRLLKEFYEVQESGRLQREVYGHKERKPNATN